MSKTPNVVKGTNKEGLVDQLDNLQKDLIICEKALAEYLETKRLAFPRFYFVSSADLLDILSNGNQADLVIRYLQLCCSESSDRNLHNYYCEFVGNYFIIMFR